MAPKLYMSEMCPFVRTVLMTAAAIELEIDKQILDLASGEHLKPDFVAVSRIF